MIHDHAYEVGSGGTFLSVDGFHPGFSTYLKLEGLNPAGSVKLVPAREMIDAAERAGILRPGIGLIESTSGNLGIALASICAAKGIRVTLVTDPSANTRSVRHMRALGAEVVIVTERDRNGGFVQTRIDHITQRLAEDPTLVWLNQYASEANPRAHRTGTAVDIVEHFGLPDWLVIGAGSTGTLMGCVEYFRSIGAPTRIVGVDVAGSILFGGQAAARWIPGIGASRRPEIFTDDGSFDKCVVEEPESIQICRWVAQRHGLLVGGSTGMALAAVRALGDRVLPGSRVVAISPDLGDRYLDSIYDDEWVLDRYGPAVLEQVRADFVPAGASPLPQLTPGL